MIPASSAFCEYLAWDSDFFGLRLGRIRSGTLHSEQVSQIDAWANENGIQGLYLLSRSDDPKVIRTAEKHGFQLVDIRLTLACERFDGTREVHGCHSEGSIRLAKATDIPALQLIARSAHSDSRFFNDRHFSRERAEALYSTWIEKDCLGRAERVLVAASPQDEPMGYVSCHFDTAAGAGQIGLVGVAAKFRGNGIGSRLVLSSLDWFAKGGAKTVRVVTQGSNRSAQRLYQRCGFLTDQVQLWYHKWYQTARGTHG
jgi:dTDP-4-amino-4,6-dideoxy-D-galactose acyltransferase